MSWLRSKGPFVVVALALVVGGVFGYRYLKARGAKTTHYETALVDRGRVTAKVTASGTLSAVVTVQVGSQVSGRLSAVLVDFNSPVKKGQLLAKIDPQIFQAALEQARANRTAAGANLAKSKVMAIDADRQYARAKQLAEKNLISAQDLDSAQATAESAHAQVQASAGQVTVASASEHQAQVNLDYTTIVSPIDGVVISRNVDQGQTVAASLSAPTLFTIAQDLSKMQVDTSVSESDVGKLSSGMATSFTVDAFPGNRFKGAIRQIRNAPTTVQNVVTYDAVIDVDNADPAHTLRPGMTANVTFTTIERNNVLRVPNAALRFRPTAEMVALLGPTATATPAGPAGAGGGADGGAGWSRRGGGDGGMRGGDTGGAPADDPAAAGGGRRGGGGGGAGGAGGGRRGGGAPSDPTKKVVYVLENGTPRAVPIVIGATDGTTTELVSGELKEGDALITDSDGTPATPKAAPRTNTPRIL